MSDQRKLYTLTYTYTTCIRRYHRSSSPLRLDLACLSLFLTWRALWLTIDRRGRFLMKHEHAARKSDPLKDYFSHLRKNRWVCIAKIDIIPNDVSKISIWQKCYAHSKQEYPTFRVWNTYADSIYSYMLPTKYSTETWDGCVVSVSPYGGHSC